jgi:hypothetical protein
MLHYVKSKREKESICNLCREKKTLSWDHVPPKGGIDLVPVEMETVFEIMAGDRERQKLRESQNGVKYRTICRECNSYLGLEYDPVINDFATSVGCYLKSGIALPEKISHKVKPQRLMKALLGHIVAAKVAIEDTTFDRVARAYVLDPNMLLPEDIHIFYWVYPYATSVTIRDFGMFVPRGTFEQPAVFQLLKYYPVAYLCSTQPEYAGLTALSWYRHAELDREIDIPINLKRVEDPYWPEAPSDEDNNVFFGGQSAATAVHARPRGMKA